MSTHKIVYDARYQGISVDGISFGTLCRSVSCCGVKELQGFQRSEKTSSHAQYLECFAAMVASKEIFAELNACVLYLVKDFPGSEIMEGALLEAGWNEIFPWTKNPNTGRMVSGWGRNRAGR